jgi:SWI/SNF-related matrix-associated actin-dependent regulator 1 of chromatin subfamily A
VVAGDETHFLKNADAIRTQQVVGSKELPPLDAEWKVAISGTPIVNRPIEMFTTLKWIDPIGWPNRTKFGRRYCQNQDSYKKFAGEFDGASNLDELQTKLRGTIMIRRMKKQALPQLPPKVRQIIEIDPGTKAKKLLTMFERQQGLVNLSPEEFRQVVKTKMGACSDEWFNNISGFRRELGLTKLPHIIEHVEEAVEMSGKVLVGCWHREVVDELLNHFTVERAVRVYGNTSMIGKDQAKERFQTDQGCQVFIGNILSSGIGLTLTASSHVIFAELDYVPGNMTQFEDRTHRITQHESVLIQHLVYANSIDAHMTKVQVEKQENIDKAVNISSDADAAIYANN